MIQPERIQPLNDRPDRRGRYVLYWMQAAQRVACNHALQHAVECAEELGLPVLAVFALADRFPGASRRHYRFMLEGLCGVGRELRERGIRLVVRHQAPPQAVAELAGEAARVVTDAACLPVLRTWRARAAEKLECRFVQVDTNAVVPLTRASDKEEWAAHTLRRKIRPLLDEFLVPLEETAPPRSSLRLEVDSLDLEPMEPLLKGLRTDAEPGPVDTFTGGEAEAHKHLKTFLDEKLDRYGEDGNDPSLDVVSNLSPYLHFGQISPLEIALAVRGRGGPGADAFLEQLIVRRELARNFVLFNPKAHTFEGLPDWARKTLRRHARDKRPHIYSPEELEGARTHDPYWNAAQKQMVLTGKMAPYMRMYWGKKILEWTPEPADAFRIALTLNDRYELDGRDPNGIAGVAWCFGKHDQAWKERPVFGKVRYMNDRGLERKFDMEAYLAQVEELETTR
jgi:deoxyribodipyrimidine photo-lyase